MGDRGTQDAALVRAAARGNADAFGQLFEHHLAAVFEAAWVVLRDREEAARVARDTFVDAWADVADLPADSVGAWLLDGARDRAVDWLRVNDPDRTVVPLATDAPPPAGIGPVLRSRIVASLELRSVPTKGRVMTAGKSRLRRQPKVAPLRSPEPQWPPSKVAAEPPVTEGPGPVPAPPTIPITAAADPPAVPGAVPAHGPPTPPGGSSRGVLPTFGVSTPVGTPRTPGPRPSHRRKPTRKPNPAADFLSTTKGRATLGATACLLVVAFFLFQRPPGDDSSNLPTGQQGALASETTTSTQAPGLSGGPTTTAAATTAPTTTVPGTTPTTRRTPPTTARPSTPAPAPQPTPAPRPSGSKPTIGSFSGTIAPWASGMCSGSGQAVQMWWSSEGGTSARVRPDGGSWASVNEDLGYHNGCAQPGATWHLEVANSAGTASASFTP